MQNEPKNHSRMLSGLAADLAPLLGKLAEGIRRPADAFGVDTILKDKPVCNKPLILR